jgi:hypothetical protein
LLRAAALAPEDERIRGTLERLVPQASARSLGSSMLPGIGLFDVLELLRLQRKSGSLAITSPRGSAVIQLWRGSITSATAPAVPPLMEVLVARGLVLRARLSGTQQEQDAEGLGHALVEERQIDRPQLARLFFARILDALAEMASWSEGAYAFRPRDEEAPPPVSFSVKHVILELVRRSDEALGTRVGSKLAQ